MKGTRHVLASGLLLLAAPASAADYLLAGGGSDVDDACRRFVEGAHGGALVVLRASGGDAYDSYFLGLGSLASVETLVISTAETARQAFVTQKIERAAAIFIAGGDQWNYMRLWNHSPAGDAIRAAVARGASLGGTSAGLAVLGEYVFTAEHDTVTSQQALANPYDARVTLERNFVQIAALKGIVTDSHFSKRDRMGRTLAFLARILEDYKVGEARAIAIDEGTAALLAPDGELRVAGAGHVYFLRVEKQAAVCRPGRALELKKATVHRAAAGDTFHTIRWTGQGGKDYDLAVSGGKIVSAGGIY